MKPCKKCGAMDRRPDGRCRPCTKAVKVARGIRLATQPCSECGETDRGSDGSCRPCRVNYNKGYKIRNAPEITTSGKAYYVKNSSKIIAYQKERYAENTVELLAKNKVHRTKNAVKIATYEKIRSKKRRATNLNYKICCISRTRLHHAVKGGFKAGSAVRDLGCTIDEFKIYMTAKFYPHPVTGEEMTWDNLGRWHIDHIIPFASIDVTNREQLLPILHYTNLQPLWAIDNLRKGDKLNWRR